ncbi:protein YgfX [Undibacterium sp. Ji67W]|uniref:protein YgfX n=1 Tax=Undibacterium sp. Ji67W TaxID=3413042 RepID=UPI003BF023CC
MTIALTVVIKPSRIILCAMLSMCFLASLALQLFLSNQQFPIFSYPGSSYLASTLAFCLFGGYALHVWCNEGVCRLDIAADGEMIWREETQSSVSGSAFPVTLGSHSVIWNAAMVLHISTSDSTNRTLIVLKDSLDAVSFQRLRVSLLWVRQHHLSNKRNKSQIDGNF